MRKLFFTLILIPFLCKGQIINCDPPPDTITDCSNLGIIDLSGRIYYDCFAQKMLDSYINLNSHIVFTNIQRQNILNRLEEPYIYNIFGPDSLDKQTCDFFYYFENSNDSTQLIERTHSKSGDTLRWNYGNDSIFYSKKQPPHVNNGIITVTSTDGFNGLTTLWLSGNSFAGPLPNFRNSGLRRLWAQSMDIEFSLTNWLLPSTFNLELLLLNNSNITGNFIYAGNPKEIDLQINNIDHFFINSDSVTTNIAEIYLNENSIPTADIDSLITASYNFFKDNTPIKNLSIDVTGGWMGHLSSNNVKYIDSLELYFTNAGYTFDLQYNSDTSSFDTLIAVFTFDDGPMTDYTDVFPLFQEKGILGTSYISGSKIGDTEAKLSWLIIQSMDSAGWDFECHGFTHSHEDLLTESQLNDEMNKQDSTFHAHNIDTAKHHAYPFYDYDALAQSTIANYRNTARANAVTGLADYSFFVWKNDDLTKMQSVTIDMNNESEYNDIIEYVDHAIDRKAAIVFTGHSAGGNEEYGGVEMQYLEQLIDYLQTRNFYIMTMKQFYDNYLVE